MTSYPHIGPYSLGYADPPWRTEVWNRENGLYKSADMKYRTMHLDEMIAIPVASWFARHAQLAMWTTDAHLEQAIELGKAWGFQYKTVLFYWNKIIDEQLRLMDGDRMIPGGVGPKRNFGQGRHSRAGGTEIVLLFGRGRGLKVRDHNIPRTFDALLREHSRKPDQINGWLEKLYGNVTRLELFARTRRPGWDYALSNQLDTFPPPPPEP